MLSGDKLEKAAATEAVGISETDQGTVANTSPLRRLSKRETKLPSYLTGFQLN